MTTKEHEVWFCPMCRGPNDEFAEECEYCGARFRKKRKLEERIEILPRPSKKKRVIQREHTWKPYQHRPPIWSASKSDRDAASAGLKSAEARFKKLSATKDQEARKMFDIYARNFHDLAEPEDAMDMRAYRNAMALLVASFTVVILMPMVLIAILAPTAGASGRAAILTVSWTVGTGLLYFVWRWYLGKRRQELHDNQSRWKVIDVLTDGDK